MAADDGADGLAGQLHPLERGPVAARCQPVPTDGPALLEVDHREVRVIADRDAPLPHQAEDALRPRRGQFDEPAQRQAPFPPMVRRTGTRRLKPGMPLGAAGWGFDLPGTVEARSGKE